MLRRYTELLERICMEHVSDSEYKNAVLALLNSEPDAGLMAPYISVLVEYLATTTGISAHFDMNEWNDATTDQGVAISPVQAAKCLQETLRSQKFMQGVHSAIKDKAAQSDETIQVLYAGTGPYATLLLPLLSVLEYTQVKATLIDIHPENVAAVKALITHFGVEDNIIDIVCADATQWQASENRSFDIIISETMTALLKREPQVFIFAHLSQYLKPSGVLIPEEVSLKSWLVDDINPDVLLGEFFKLDLEHALDIYKGDRSAFSGSQLIPEGFETGYRFKLTTDIKVYGTHYLTENECSLNIPLTFLPHKAILKGGDKIHYDYVTPNSADFVFRFPLKVIPTSEQELSSWDVTTSNGIKLVKRIYERSQTGKHGGGLSVPDNEWQAQLRLVELLDLPLHSVMQALFEYESFPLFEQWLIEHYEGLENPVAVNTMNDALMDCLLSKSENTPV